MYGRCPSTCPTSFTIAMMVSSCSNGPSPPETAHWVSSDVDICMRARSRERRKKAAELAAAPHVHVKVQESERVRVTAVSRLCSFAYLHILWQVTMKFEQVMAEGMIY